MSDIGSVKKFSELEWRWTFCVNIVGDDDAELFHLPSEDSR